MKVYPSSLVLMPRTLQMVYSREDYCLFAVIPTGVLLSVVHIFFVCNYLW
jgi:hypothetical protein